jgi:membrane-associated PAP2 superfamily phosphatase
VTFSTHVRLASVAAALVFIVTLLAMVTDFDLAISDALYSPHNSWPVSHAYGALRFFLYDGPIWLLGLLAIGLAAAAAFPRLLGQSGLSRRECLFALTCLVATPVLVGTLKDLSGVACAYDLARYGGTLSDELGRYPFMHPGAGRCWPAAHPSGAFALLCLGALHRPRHVRRSLWLLALGAGLVLGAYQVARGAHFVSHVIITALVAQVVASSAAAVLLSRTQREITSSPPM